MEINIFQSIILGIVEGLTEFLPISSTGHLILANKLLGITGEKIKLFDVFIQLGAIFAVLWYFRKKIFSMISKIPKDKNTQNFALSIIIAFCPAAITGFFAHKLIKQYLFSPLTVAVALILGGIAIYIIERMKHSDRVTEIESTPFKIALWVGLAQILSLFPGVSRAGATIMGGLLAGMTRKASTEFSFFLAIPIMFAATIFDLSKSYSELNPSDILILSVGFVFAFISALIVIKWFIRFVSVNNFKPFALYRIILGTFFLIFYFLAR